MNPLTTTHATKNGQVMLVASMETRHLLYTIRYHLRQYLQLKKAAERPTDENSRFQKRLYQGAIQTITPEDAAMIVANGLEKDQVYMTEVYYRIQEIALKPELLAIHSETVKLYLELTDRAQILPQLMAQPQPRLGSGSVWDELDEDPGWEMQD